MNTKITISKAIYSAFFSTAMLFATSSAFAQVKIGSSPTVIGANENLEIEATDGSKTTANKTTGQFTVTTVADPVKFIGLQPGTANTNKALLVNPVDGVVKYGDMSVKAMSIQSDDLEGLNPNAFYVNSNNNRDLIAFGQTDIILDSDIADLAASTLTMKETGYYDIQALCNVKIEGAWNDGAASLGMGINLIVERLAPGQTAWQSISGSRTFYPNLGTVGFGITCQTSSVAKLVVGDQLRLVISRGNGDYLLSGTVNTGDNVNGIPYTKALRLFKIK